MRWRIALSLKDLARKTSPPSVLGCMAGAKMGVEVKRAGEA